MGTAHHKKAQSVCRLAGDSRNLRFGTTHPDRYAIHTLGMGGAYPTNGRHPKGAFTVPGF